MAIRVGNTNKLKQLRFILSLVLHVVVFFTLTILTQVGGIIYLASIPFFKVINKKLHKKYIRVISKTLSFIFLYLFVCLLILPPIAKLFGREALPITSENLKPATLITVLCNRHYVKPKLKTILLENAKILSKSNRGKLVTYYLDANFPFINGFPLLPHLSHNDGKKVDIAFYYTTQNNTSQKQGSPSPIGYGIGVEPQRAETNTAKYCTQLGYWQYNIIDRIMTPFAKRDYDFDAKNTALLLNLLSHERDIEKVFIEPFLAKRLKVNSPKIRFHGYRAVSHADHIHIQLK